MNIARRVWDFRTVANEVFLRVNKQLGWDLWRIVAILFLPGTGLDLTAGMLSIGAR